MIDKGKKNLLGVWVDAVDYEAAVSRIIAAARERAAYSVAAVAVHGVMSGVLDPEQRWRLNHVDLVVPDGQPVRWGLNLLHGTGLRDRVYGPNLTLQTCSEAALARLPVFLYGSREETVSRLGENLSKRVPGLEIAGFRPSLFRRLTADEATDLARTIRASGAAITLVGFGCPRQETWVYEFAPRLSMPALAVGAAFDFHAGTLPQAPEVLQDSGLEWAFRLVLEPRRLWRRYLILNPLYLLLLGMQIARIKKFDATSDSVPGSEALHG